MSGSIYVIMNEGSFSYKMAAILFITQDMTSYLHVLALVGIIQQLPSSLTIGDRMFVTSYAVVWCYFVSSAWRLWCQLMSGCVILRNVSWWHLVTSDNIWAHRWHLYSSSNIIPCFVFTKQKLHFPTWRRRILHATSPELDNS